MEAKEKLKAEDIRLQFFNENNGAFWINSQNEPDIDYVWWLENKLLSLLSKEKEEKCSICNSDRFERNMFNPDSKRCLECGTVYARV